MNKSPLHIALINTLDALLTTHQETQAKLTAETRAKGISPGRTRAEMLAQQRTNFERYQQSGSMSNDHRMQMLLRSRMPHIPITMFNSIRGHAPEIDSTIFNKPVNSIFDPAVFNVGNYTQMTKSTPDADACPGCTNCRPSAQPARTLGEDELTKAYGEVRAMNAAYNKDLEERKAKSMMHPLTSANLSGFNRYAEFILDSPMDDEERNYFKDWTAPVLPDPETIQWKDLAAEFAEQDDPTDPVPRSHNAPAQTLHDILQAGLNDRREHKRHMTLTELQQRINVVKEAAATPSFTVKLDEEDVDPVATVAAMKQAYVDNNQQLMNEATVLLERLEEIFNLVSKPTTLDPDVAIKTKYFQDNRDRSTNPHIYSLSVSTLMEIQNHDDVMNLILQLFPEMSRIDGRDDAYWISHDGEKHILPVINDVVDTALEITDICRLSAIVYVDYEMIPRSNLYKNVKQAHEKLLAIPRPDVGPDHYVIYICH